MNTIATEIALREAAREHLATDTLLHWRWRDEEARHGHSRADAILQVDAGGRKRTFEVEFKLLPNARALDALVARPHRHPWLLIAPKLSETLISLCRERRINALDLNGRVFVNLHGLVIDRTSSGRHRVRPSLPSVDPFASKSSRLSRALLSNPGRDWTLSELAGRTGLTAGLVSRLLRFMENEGWIGRAERKIRLVRSNELLDAWTVSDDWRRRTTVREYSALTADLEELAARVRDDLIAESTALAFTQWFAAGLRFPYTTPPAVTAYIPTFPDLATEQSLGLRRVDGGGRLWLVIPRDEGVFQETRKIRGFRIVSDTQIYLDLVKAGLRGPDQARALREWAGFNAPA